MKFPLHVATEGLLDEAIGIATRGWIVPEVAPAPPPGPPIVVTIFSQVELVAEYDWIVELEAEYDWDP
ncbi:hypothetical protein LCGC14_1486960 [marine sediment metagenome]|uniref:Uncharacterized protein n=1 Tax=marine sediment metagenome TaxID=412755 RepID=A0A0F9JTS2_9ZZZZ